MKTASHCLSQWRCRHAMAAMLCSLFDSPHHVMTAAGHSINKRRLSCWPVNCCNSWRLLDSRRLTSHTCRQTLRAPTGYAYRPPPVPEVTSTNALQSTTSHQTKSRRVFYVDERRVSCDRLFLWCRAHWDTDLTSNFPPTASINSEHSFNRRTKQTMQLSL